MWEGGRRCSVGRWEVWCGKVGGGVVWGGVVWEGGRRCSVGGVVWEGIQRTTNALTFTAM